MALPEQFLMLLRHAKSRWDEPDLPDFGRGLAPRGTKAASRIGKWLLNQNLMPDLVLCSSAERAAQTWSLASAEMHGQPECRLLKSLYLAPPSRIAATIKRHLPSRNNLLFVGHNPGLHQFCLQLLGDAAPKPLQDNLPTAALLVARLPQGRQADIGRAQPLHFILPRDLKTLDN